MTAPSRAGLAAVLAAALGLATPAGPGLAHEDGLLHRDHPLAGTIWSPRESRILDADEAHDMLAAADVAILGEVHDNARHHELQARFLEAIVARGHRPAVVYEMIPTDLQPAVDTHIVQAPDDAEGLGEAVGWEARGWPDWATYRPIAEVALASRLAIRAGGLSAETQRRLMREGAGALPEDERARLGLDHELPPEAAALLDEVLFEAHCDLIPREALPAMRQIQWARDGAMADAIERAAADGPAVLIAGAGHGRRDWGVPAQLAARQAGLAVVSLALVEVAPDRDDPADYLPEGAGGEPVYDLLVFTARAERDDPCEALRERFAPPEAERPDRP